MDKFVIETFVEGEMLIDETVECDQRLLNEQDLDVICVNKNISLVFVRQNAKFNDHGYYIADDGRWDYGSREEAISVIKRRI